MAHNLKVVSSNLAPATKKSFTNQRLQRIVKHTNRPRNGGFLFSVLKVH